uniref:Uncharacterized protein n=1 Tax=Lactuca sativa TaxID=4236 RepID=A0A9R1XBV7_LACSA|nr:hypothetical protein LSAT_V11C500236180 [Lactuca sativa]
MYARLRFARLFLCIKPINFLEDQHKLKKKYIGDCPSNELPNRDNYYTNLLKVSIPDVVDIENPSDIRNKGSGSRGKRLKSKKEMLQLQGLKPKRLCASCQQMVNHDKQNCPLKDKAN